VKIHGIESKIILGRNDIMKLVAVLSTTVLPLDGEYRVKTVEQIDITGVAHYIGHPATKAIVEGLGAVQSESKLFPGLKPGESAVCFAIKQGLSSRATEGKTVDQEVTPDMLQIRTITRLVEEDTCPFCKQSMGRPGNF
jgi:hypothetical protein